MTNSKVAVVVTSIAGPNKALEMLARGCREQGYDFIVIGDEASPTDFSLPGCRFYSLEEQKGLPFKFARLCPVRHYARKNLGYLIAWQNGASIILETDDDNLPYESFWSSRTRERTIPLVTRAGWVNVYRYFSDTKIWPRGLPLNYVNDDPPSLEVLGTTQVDCPIQQGLVDDNPDTDAIFRLTVNEVTKFEPDRQIVLAPNCWSPFNSQNTTWWRDAFPLLYLPAYCSFRMTDIWRSFVAQRIAWVNRWSVAFHAPSMWQERNQHDLMKDFCDEVPGYLNNESICRALGELELVPGLDHLGDNLVSCYERLVSMGIFAREELTLIAAWLEDLASVQSGRVGSAAH